VHSYKKKWNKIALIFISLMTDTCLCNFVTVVSILFLVLLPPLPFTEHMYLRGVKAQCGRLSVRPYEFNEDNLLIQYIIKSKLFVVFVVVAVAVAVSAPPPAFWNFFFKKKIFKKDVVCFCLYVGRDRWCVRVATHPKISIFCFIYKLVLIFRLRRTVT
jgi:hypothetical protein